MPTAVEQGIQNIGYVGSLIGASMETAGHHTQALLLKEFGGQFGVTLGGLLYLIAIIGALITLASGASYRYGLYLLIGPPLFFFLVTKTTPSGGAEWRFGNRVHDQNAVKRGTQGLLDDGIGEVSLFFYGWNKLTSNVVQGMVALTRLSDGGSDLDFMNKADRYFALWGQNTLDPRLSGFVNATLINKCADYFVLVKRLANPMIEDVEGAKKLLEKHGGNAPVVKLQTEPWLNTWIDEALKAGNQSAIQQYREKGNNEGLTCPDLWALSIEIFKAHGAPAIIEILVSSDLPPGYTKEQARKMLLKKFNHAVGNGDAIKEYESARDTNGQTSQAAQENLQLTVLINELAARLVFKEMSKLNPNLAALDMNQHPELVREGDRFSGETSRGLRMLQTSDEYQYKGEVIVGGLTVPYIQGCVLYFLAATFPFFALCIVVPGRHTGFLLWMGLWLWAKLWDLGFAVVMMIDNMLYALMPHGEAMSNDIVKDPGLAMKTLLAVDPTYSAGTYYNLVGCCLLAVPMVTGFIVHRGGQEITNLVSNTYRDFPQKFGTSTAAYKRAMMAQHNLKKARLQQWHDFEESALAILASDKKYHHHQQRRMMFESLKTNLATAKTAAERAQAFNQWKTSEGVRGNLGLVAELKPWLDKGADAYLDPFLDANIETEKQRAGRQIAESMQIAAYKASKSDYSIAMAGEAILNRFNSHDFRRPFPVAAVLNRVGADHYKPQGQAWDKFLDGFYNAATRRN